MSITKLYTVLCMERAYYHELMNTLECCYTLVIEILLTEMFVCIIICYLFFLIYSSKTKNSSLNSMDGVNLEII